MISSSQLERYRRPRLNMSHGLCRETAWVSEYGISEAKVRTVVALVASAICGAPVLTSAQLEKKTGYRSQSFLRELERKGWVILAGRCGREQGWRAAHRAFERLGFRDWKPELRAEKQAKWLETNP